jgi:hypothetical protein
MPTPNFVNIEFMNFIHSTIFSKIALNKTILNQLMLNLLVQVSWAINRTVNLSEAEYRDALFSPLLKTIMNSASIIPYPGGGEIESQCRVEHSIELRPTRAGRKPAVDCVMRADMGDNVLSYSPVEAKHTLTKENLQQLSLYMVKIGTAKELSEHCLLGYLIDKKTCTNCDFSIDVQE